MTNDNPIGGSDNPNAWMDMIGGQYNPVYGNQVQGMRDKLTAAQAANAQRQQAMEANRQQNLQAQQIAQQNFNNLNNNNSVVDDWMETNRNIIGGNQPPPTAIDVNTAQGAFSQAGQGGGELGGTPSNATRDNPSENVGERKDNSGFLGTIAGIVGGLFGIDSSVTKGLIDSISSIGDEAEQEAMMNDLAGFAENATEAEQQSFMDDMAEFSGGSNSGNATGGATGSANAADAGQSAATGRDAAGPFGGGPSSGGPSSGPAAHGGQW